eukprot:1909712-Pyramimonas_sp.AAC.1
MAPSATFTSARAKPQHVNMDAEGKKRRGAFCSMDLAKTWFLVSFRGYILAGGGNVAQLIPSPGSGKTEHRRAINL